MKTRSTCRSFVNFILRRRFLFQQNKKEFKEIASINKKT